MELLMSIMMMAIERIITLRFSRQMILTMSHMLKFVAVLWIISLCLALPTLTNNIPVKLYKFRYVCDIDSKTPMLYPIVRLLIFAGCLLICLICFAAFSSMFWLVSREYPRELNSSPSNSSERLPQATTASSCKLGQNLNLVKLVFLLLILFIFFDGPYIILNFYTQLRNSKELFEEDCFFETGPNVDSVLTLLRFVFPLVAPLVITIELHVDIRESCLHQKLSSAMRFLLLSVKRYE
ncbi:unnamed protein product [Thelazia callipaeda]|uniref:G_PROTEIN_RECEP_F1_2 domain-containing protein n=1 Tax=Thelazia callipaeda TaxID=103827 RepID=A0A158RAQ8_THECL|nr:unnamed protein product [Thelazia callipaeda]